MKSRVATLLLGLFGLAAAASAQPVVRVSVAQKPPLLVGQQVRIDVQVFVPNFFMGAPRFPVLEVPGAVVTLSDDAVNLNETIRGEAYAGIQRSYLFVASTAGTYTLPAAEVRVTYAAVPGQPPATVGAAIPRHDLTIEWPAGMSPADAPAGMLVARVTIEQQVDRADLNLRVGDALTRTLTVTAEHTAAMFIPPPSFEAPPGIQIYPRDPALRNDADGRGALIAGHRTDAAVYVFQRPGTFELPAIDFVWYDVTARRSRAATAPAITVTVAASASTVGIAPEAEAPPPPARQRLDWRGIGTITVPGLIMLTMLGLLWRWVPQRLRRYHEHRLRVAASEPAGFAQFEHACRRGEPNHAYAELLRWMQTRPPNATGDWRRNGHRAFEAQVSALEATLFAPQARPTRWDGRELAATAAQIRAAHPLPPPQRGRGRNLSSLNPSGET